MTKAPGLTYDGVDHAAAGRSRPRGCRPRGRPRRAPAVREWQIVTVAVGVGEHQRDRTADDGAAPDHHGAAAAERQVAAAQQFHAPERRARCHRPGVRPRRAGRSCTGGNRRRPCRRDARRSPRRGSICAGQRQLHEDPVDALVGVERAGPARPARRWCCPPAACAARSGPRRARRRDPCCARRSPTRDRRRRGPPRATAARCPRPVIASTWLASSSRSSAATALPSTMTALIARRSARLALDDHRSSDRSTPAIGGCLPTRTLHALDPRVGEQGRGDPSAIASSRLYCWSSTTSRTSAKACGHSRACRRCRRCGPRPRGPCGSRRRRGSDSPSVRSASVVAVVAVERHALENEQIRRAWHGAIVRRRRRATAARPPSRSARLRLRPRERRPRVAAPARGGRPG